MPGELEKLTSAREIVWREAGRTAVGDKGRIGDAQRKPLTQESVLDLRAGFEIIVVIDVRVIGFEACIGETALLAYGGRLVRQRVAARRVDNLILPDIRIECDGRIRIQDMDPARGDVIA